VPTFLRQAEKHPALIPLIAHPLQQPLRFKPIAERTRGSPPDPEARGLLADRERSGHREMVQHLEHPAYESGSVNGLLGRRESAPPLPVQARDLTGSRSGISKIFRHEQFDTNYSTVLGPASDVQLVLPAARLNSGPKRFGLCMAGCTPF
jgi:hypothetical protein